MARALCQRFPMLQATHAQVWSYAPAFRRPRHFHAEPELNLVVSGVARFGIGDAVAELRAGDLLLFPPGQDHELLDASRDLALFVIGIRSDFARRTFDDTHLGAPLRLRGRVNQGDLERFAARSADVAARAGAEQAVAELWDAARWTMERGAEHAFGTLHVNTRRALDVLRSSPELTRDDLARIAHAPPGEISRHFHRDLGVTLVEYRTRLRLFAFLRRLDAGATTLLSAALDAGFGSYAQFQRSFCETFGCTPRHFINPAARHRFDDLFEPLGAAATE